MALLQVQALIVSLLAGVVAFALGMAERAGVPGTGGLGSENRGGYFECLMVLCASMLAASWSSAIVGCFMCSLVVLSRKFGINPGPFSLPVPPVSSSLGD
jgi:solute carrier family 41